ncbi:hypothetical protein AB0M46_16150 [Dactylosporangium sp. NPDC051485]|uniref:hypothetical protein n=1 Tax=Dactylosporangium sp. NPDC051485 TaxID=3154846 RepID=UPI003423C9A3
MSTKRKGAPRPGTRPARQIAPGGQGLATAGPTSDSTTGPAPAGATPNGAAGPASNGPALADAAPTSAADAAGPASNGAAPAAAMSDGVGGAFSGPAGPASNDPVPAGAAFNGGVQGGALERDASVPSTGGPEGGDAGGVANMNGGDPDPARPEDAGRRSMSPAVEQLLDVGIRVAGLLIAVLLAIVFALFEVFYSPLRIGGVRVPVSLVVALATNPLLGWFAFTTSRLRLAALLPGAAWCVIWFGAAGKTSEGDLLITSDNWVGLLTLFTGSLAFAIGIYVSSMRQRLSPGSRSGPGAGPSATSPTAGA